MSLRLTLEDFGASNASLQRSASAPDPAEQELQDALEHHRAQGYEAGYRAGWDDATKAAIEEHAHIDAELARNLEDLGFTYHEARGHVLNSLEALLTEVTGTLLPKVVEASLAPVVAEQVAALAADAADTPIEIRVSPGNRQVVQDLCSRALAIPLEIKEEDSLPDGQVYLRSGKNEKQIDLSAALSKIEAAIAALYELRQEAFENG